MHRISSMKHAINIIVFTVICLMPYPASAFEKAISWEINAAGLHHVFTAYRPDFEIAAPTGKCAKMDKAYRYYLKTAETRTPETTAAILRNPKSKNTVFEKFSLMEEDEFQETVRKSIIQTPRSEALFLYKCDPEAKKVIYKSLIHSVVTPLEKSTNATTIDEYTKRTYIVEFLELGGAMGFQRSTEEKETLQTLPKTWL
jgi:hypothetical protein